MAATESIGMPKVQFGNMTKNRELSSELFSMAAGSIFFNVDCSTSDPASLTRNHAAACVS